MAKHQSIELLSLSSNKKLVPILMLSYGVGGGGQCQLVLTYSKTELNYRDNALIQNVLLTYVSTASLIVAQYPRGWGSVPRNCAPKGSGMGGDSARLLTLSLLIPRCHV